LTRRLKTVSEFCPAIEVREVGSYQFKTKNHMIFYVSNLFDFLLPTDNCQLFYKLNIIINHAGRHGRLFHHLMAAVSVDGLFDVAGGNTVITSFVILFALFGEGLF